MSTLTRVDLVGNFDYRSKAIALQMVALHDHLAYTREACTASRLATPEG